MAFDQVAFGSEGQRSAVFAAVPGVLGYSLRDLRYTTFLISALKHHYQKIPANDANISTDREP